MTVWFIFYHKLTSIDFVSVIISVFNWKWKKIWLHFSQNLLWMSTKGSPALLVGCVQSFSILNRAKMDFSSVRPGLWTISSQWWYGGNFKRKANWFEKKAIMIIQFIDVDFSMAIGLNDYVFFFVLNEHAVNGGFCGFAHVLSYSQKLPSSQASLFCHFWKSLATFGAEAFCWGLLV